MTDWQERLTELLGDLERQSDELRLKLGLGKLEAREEWDDVESRLEELRGRVKAALAEADDASDDVGEAAEHLAGEIRKAFDRVRRKLL